MEHGSWFHADNGNGEGLTSAVTGAEIADAYANPETAMPKVVDQLYSRPPWERMMRIHERIQSGNHPNCNQLARESEVSNCTIKRDIDFMKCRLVLPTEYDERRYRYYYSRPRRYLVESNLRV